MNVNFSSPGYWYKSFSTVFFSSQYKLFWGYWIECVYGSTWGPFQEYFFFFVDTRYFTIAVILIAQNTNSFFDYMLVRPYSFQCKFTKCPNEHICELFCKPQNVDNLICLCKYITPSTVQCSCMHIYLYPLCWDHACTWNIWFLFQDSTVSMEKVNFKKNGGFYSNMYECCIFYLKCM